MFSAREEQFLDTIGPPPVNLSTQAQAEEGKERTATCSELRTSISADAWEERERGRTNVTLVGRGVLRGDGCSAIVGWETSQHGVKVEDVVVCIRGGFT